MFCGALRARCHACSHGLRLWVEDLSGSIAIPFALMLIVILVFAGAAIDIGRWLHARQQTVAAMDAAVLAGGRELQLDSTNLSGAIAAAQQYYAENTKGRMKLLSDSISFTPANNNTSFTATGNAFIETPLLGLVNINSLPLLENSGAEYSKAQIKSGGGSGINVEISVMLDVTGSMAGTKFTDMKAAATDLVNIVANSTSDNTVKVAIVPFAEAVRLPSTANSAARGSPPSSKTLSSSCGWWGGSCGATYYRTVCVVERTGINKYTDAAPGSGNYVMTLYTDNGQCGSMTPDDEVLPLTSDKTTLKNKISYLDISGSTAGQVGTAWAWYVLSPNWNNLWSSSGAAAYNASTTNKIAILMTDGEYNTQYDANGVLTGSAGAGAAANGTSTTQARSLCAAAKAKGITIYTVGFDLGGNQAAIDTLSGCATDAGKYYNADDGEQLKQVFRDIALKISDLYLSQ